MSTELRGMDIKIAAANKDVRHAMAKNRAPRWVMPLVKVGVVGADFLITAVSFVVAFKLREGSPVLSSTAWAWSHEFLPYAGIFYFALLLKPTLLAYQRIYRFHGEFAYTQDAIRIFKAVSVSSLLIIT